MARNSIADDVLGEIAKSGNALRFQDIEGIGPKTEERLTGVRGVRAPRDVQDYSADELASEAGISRSRAESAIRGAGGTPDYNTRSSTSSVSAAGIRFGIGDFRVEAGADDSAEFYHQSRTDTARRVDSRRRAPITTEVDQWKDNPGKFDFPGVDTPSDNPGLQHKDLPYQSEQTVRRETGDLVGDDQLPDLRDEGAKTRLFEGARQLLERDE
jgi:hypothetical protein